MPSNRSTTRKVAALVCAGAVLSGAAACTKEVDGTATAAKVEKTTSSKSKSSSKSSNYSSSSDDGGGGTAAAPDQPYSYEDGTTVKLDAAQPADLSGVFDNEVGRILPFHIDNKSKWTLDLSFTTYEAEIDCAGSSAFVFGSEPIVGPEQLPTGQTGDYQLSVALKKADVGKTCTITIPFEAVGASDTDVATFEMVLS